MGLPKSQAVETPNSNGKSFERSASIDLKSDFDQRIASFDHWLDAGFTDINQGVLVGLAKDPVEEMFNLLSHAD